MPPATRPATPQDIPQLVPLLMADAAERQARDAILWTVAADAATQIRDALTVALTSTNQPFRQFWHVAEEGGKITGVIHAMLLPVPPIYAGPKGPPGLILPDSCVAANASDATIDALMQAAETALQGAGARILLTSFVTGDRWQQVFDTRNYAPLTLYLARTDLQGHNMPTQVRPATDGDVPGIVTRSAENRQVLFDIDPFWDIHPEADSRFAAWMARSLTLPDRDMMVLAPTDQLDGYVIAQPASRLHFPPAHDISRTGVIDDYFHVDFGETETLAQNGEGATALLHAAEAAFVARDIQAACVVCPAGWRSKIKLLRDAGYDTAMVWSIKRD
ncbi:hypothetical protein [Tateyamaria omphalii]|uniref:Uncharacterized protein n=1 Tax=Tateyamaria omphalii TaxID=299262 RepID=A0A1P8MWH8_9RHOB|nr:hypothetical protein [Tateyamaria omphalii]APX12371.1 hypothetical protein BWR18_12300 [Tateyamaria omphalii]